MSDAPGASEEAVFVYGIVPADTVIPEDLVGLHDGPPEVLGSGDVGALVDPVDPERPLGTRADLLGYQRVLDTVGSTTTVVPVAFGSVLPDGASVLEDLLQPNQDHFVELLAYFQGRRQFTLRARYLQDVVLAEVVEEDPEIAQLREDTRSLPEDAGLPGRIRLGELVAAAVQEKRWVDGQEILDHLAPLAVEHREREASDLEHLMELTLLVEDERSGELETAAEELAERMSGRARLSLLGPMPPYDFVQEG